MKEITLQIEDEHYNIIKHFANLKGESIDEFVLMAAKSAISSCVEAESDGCFESYTFAVHKHLGGEYEG